MSKSILKAACSILLTTKIFVFFVSLINFFVHYTSFGTFKKSIFDPATHSISHWHFSVSLETKSMTNTHRSIFNIENVHDLHVPSARKLSTIHVGLNCEEVSLGTQLRGKRAIALMNRIGTQMFAYWLQNDFDQCLCSVEDVWVITEVIASTENYFERQE